MPAWLSLSGYSAEARFAVWAVVAVGLTTFVLFLYTLGLRVATMRGARRQKYLVSGWREHLAAAMLDRDEAETREIPPIRRGQRVPLLELWNRTQLAVEGEAADNLNIFANRIGLDRVAGLLFHSRSLRDKVLAVQALGHLRDVTYRDPIVALVPSRVTMLSITAALALVEIDADLAVSKVVPMISRRRDWPKTQVSLFLRMAGSERCSEPLYRALRNADDDDTIFLLNFAGLIESDVLDALVVELLRESRNPGLINAALKLVTGFLGVPRLATLTRHDAWFVRMQAAKVLGRLGEEEHLSLLESMLEDSEWWVRYRAAQSLVSLPFLGPNKLRQIRERQDDRYAEDILEQALAEAGIA